LEGTKLRKADVAAARFVGATGYDLAKAKNGGQALR